MISPLALMEVTQRIGRARRSPWSDRSVSGQLSGKADTAAAGVGGVFKIM